MVDPCVEHVPRDTHQALVIGGWVAGIGTRISIVIRQRIAAVTRRPFATERDAAQYRQRALHVVGRADESLDIVVVHHRPPTTGHWRGISDRPQSPGCAGAAAPGCHNLGNTTG